MSSNGPARHRFAGARLVGWTLTFLATAACGTGGVTSAAGPEGPAQTAYAPPAGKGPIVVVLSGHSGPGLYHGYAAELSRLGYYTVLLDGKDILTREQDGAANLRKAIERAQRSSQAIPGKAAVIRFSQGGGGALAHGANMPDLVSTVVAYYPQTGFVSDMRRLAARFQVPVLVLAGEADRYHNCCPIESMRAMETAAGERRTPFELVVYPYADHGFNLRTSAYRGEDGADAWRRTTEALRRYHPLP
jgi:pimeloyl-ACP methyl ester carboxylesterase